MGRRRKSNKKNGENGLPTPTPENGDGDGEVDVDEADASTSEQAAEPVHTEVPAAPPAAPAAEPIQAAPEQHEETVKDETPATTPAPAEAPPAAAAPLEANEATTTTTAAADAPAHAPAGVPADAPAETPQPPTPDAAPVDGVAALNAYALENASTSASNTAVTPPSEEVAEPKPSAGEATSEVLSVSSRTSTKKVAFITPVISSIASASDNDTPRESNCIEARCGSCSVM